MVGSLAYAELYLVFAHFFRAFKPELHETTKEDMDWGDFFITVTRGHLKVMIHKVDAA
jgi:hypothetical protein